MAGRIPRDTVIILNRLTWLETAENHRYQTVDGEKVPTPRPEGKVWFASTGHDGAEHLSDVLRKSAGIDAQIDFVGDSFGVSVPPSQLSILAENGATFARKALKNPDVKRVEPASRWRV